jgi:XPB/Ssl2-like helicase family protein
MAQHSPTIEGLEAGAPPFRSQWLRQGLVPDLTALLSLLGKEELTLLKSGKLPKRLAETLVPRLEHVPVAGDPGRYLDFLLDAALELGLLRTNQRRLLVTERVESWLAQPLLTVLRELYELWLDSTHWDELYRLPGIRVESTGLRSSPQGTRRFVLQVLGSLPVGQWTSLGALLEHLRAAHPFFYRPLRDERNWKLRAEGPGAAELLLGEGSWYEVEGRLVASIVAEPAHWLGMTAVGIDERGALCSLQLTRLGGVLLGGLEESELHLSQPPDEIHVQPNFEVLVPDEVDLAIRYHVERFAERVSTDKVLTFRLTRGSVLEALSSGESVEQFLDFLQRHSRKELPQNVAYSLRSWGKLYGQVELRPAVLLEARTPELLEELRQHARLGPRLGKALSETLCELPAGGLEEVLEALGEAGHLPRLDEALRGPGQGSVAVDDQEAYCLILGLLFLREGAVLHRMSPKDQSIESLLQKLSRINDGEIFEQASQDFERIQKERARRQRQAQSIIE